MSTVNVNNLNPNGDPVITLGPEADATEGARLGIVPAPSGATLDDSSLVFGHDALTSASTGRSNIAIGSESQKNTTDGRYNISVGNSALENCNSGEGNIAIGNGAMKGAVSPLEGNDQNVAIGFNSLKSIDAYGASNVAIGSESGGSITAGTQNTFVGNYSGRLTTATTIGSTFVGSKSGENATGNYCVFLGSSAGINAQANSSVGLGRSAGSSTGSNGTFVGDLAGISATAQYNTCIGYRAGSRLTTGEKNTLIGTYAGSTGDTDTGSLITGSNNIILQSGGFGEWDLGADVSNAVVLGSSTQTTIYAGVNTITALSDKRDKKDVKEISAGLEFVKELKPVDFIWDERKETGKRGIKDCGFLAQDLKETEEKHGVADHLRLVDDKNPEKLLATYGRLLPVMVKAIQELSAEVEKLKA